MSTHLPKHAIVRLLEIGAEPEPEGDAESSGDIGKYRIVREVGRGGMGIVYEAEDTQLGRTVALKVMPETAGLSTVLRRRFAREATAAAKLTHPSIAAVFEASADYIAMQFVRGKTLLEDGRREPRRLVRWIRDAAGAVAYAHERGIIHRDLKPTNLLIESSGSTGDGDGDDDSRIYVLDFGLAKETAIDSSLSGSGSLLGTPAYMSPEQAQGRAQDIDTRSDVYGLGATLYAGLKGQPPFTDDDVIGILRKVVDQDPLPPKVDRDLDAIVMKCLAKERERRYQTARDLQDDLQRWLDGVPVRAAPPSIAYRMRKFVAQRRAMFWAGGLTLVGALLVLLPILHGITQRNEATNQALGLYRRVEVCLANADALLRDGKPGEAQDQLGIGIEECRRFLASVSEEPSVGVLLGRLLRRRQRRDEAARVLRRALRSEPDNPAAKFELGLVELAELRSLENLEDLGPDPSEGVNEAAAAASKQRMEALRRSVLDNLSVVVEQRDEFKDVDVLYGAAEVSRLRGDLGAARQGLEDLVERAPMHLDAKRSLALVYRKLGLRQESIEMSSELTDIGRGLLQAFGQFNAGVAVPTPEDVETHTLSDILPGPALEGAVLNAPLRYLESPTPEHKDASQAMMRLIEAARRTVAKDALVLDKWRDVVDLHNGLLDGRDDPIAFNNRGLCWAAIERLLIDAGRSVEAITAQRNAMTDFEAALRIVPNCPAALRNRAQLRIHQAERLAQIGRFHPATLKLDAAIRDASRVLKRFEADIMSRVDRARAHVLRGEYREAQELDAQQDFSYGETDFIEATRRNSEPGAQVDPRAHMFYGEFLIARGRWRPGIDQLSLAIKTASVEWLYREKCETRLASLRSVR